VGRKRRDEREKGWGAFSETPNKRKKVGQLSFKLPEKNEAPFGTM